MYYEDLPIQCQEFVKREFARFSKIEGQEGYLPELYKREKDTLERVLASPRRETLAAYLTRAADPDRGQGSIVDDQFLAWQQELLTGTVTCPSCWNTGEHGSRVVGAAAECAVDVNNST